ncbi:MAG TPA: rod shape-determining protein MreC [Candidatus Paceibacterota bacterium]
MAATLVGLVFVMGDASSSQKISNKVLQGTLPFWRGENFFTEKMRVFGGFLLSKKTLIQENQSLSSRVNMLEVQLMSKNMIVEENNDLKELMGRSNFSEGLLATVVSKPNRSPYDTLLLDVGEEHGVATGDKVFAHDEVAIGLIEEVSQNVSRVKLFSSPGEEIEVTIGSEHVGAVAHGQGGGNFEVSLPRGVDIQEGDVISFPSISTEVLGIVEKIQAEASDSFQTILFKNPVNMNELHFVVVRIK